MNLSASETRRFYISIVVAFLELACTIALVAVTFNLSGAANQIAEMQTAISRGESTPEFVYLGPQKKVSQNVDGNSDQMENEEDYDYGMIPQFAKVSGFADNLSASAHQYYELTIVKDSNNGDSGFRDSEKDALHSISLEVVGGSRKTTVALNDGVVVLSVGESGSENLNFEKLEDSFQAKGYRLVRYESFFVVVIEYSDVVGELQTKTYYVDNPKKENAIPEMLFDHSTEDPIHIELKAAEQNFGLPLSFNDDLADECIDRIERH